MLWDLVTDFLHGNLSLPMIPARGRVTLCNEVDLRLLLQRIYLLDLNHRWTTIQSVVLINSFEILGNIVAEVVIIVV